MQQAFIGVDVGTSSARAGVFDEAGTLALDRPASDRGLARCRRCRRTIVVRHLGGLRRRGSRRDGGSSTCRRTPSRASGSMRPVRWWCSTARRQPLTVSTSGDNSRNVIVWMDHRATAEARSVNDTQDDVLRYVGGSISPEMEIPKILWLKRHLPVELRCGRAFLRSRRFPLIPRHRIVGAFGVHA